MDINTFLSYKTHDNCQELDNNTLKLFNSLIDYNKKKNFNKSFNILKSKKINNKKENIINKVNLILNKLSDTNSDGLILEFIENINQVDNDTFNEIQKGFFYKILSEIKFIKIYINFLKSIMYIYNSVQKYNLSYFILLVETLFKYNYSLIELDETNLFLKELNNDEKRTNNLILIRNLVEYNILSKDVIKECDTIIINQNIYLSDIYHWYNFKNRKLTNDEITIIKEHIKNDISKRDTILLENIINNNLSTNTFKLESDDIINEYLLNNDSEIIITFINNRCVDAISKNKFCEYLIDYYFINNNVDNILELLEILINNQILFKSNISKGLLNVVNNWLFKTNKLEKLLLVLKKLSITKNIEHLMDKFLVCSV
jgi:hypothetical protein